jgi:hypothetical protein
MDVQEKSLQDVVCRYNGGWRVSEQFARSWNMFHATCYYNPIRYSPLNLKEALLQFSGRLLPAWLAESLESNGDLDASCPAGERNESRRCEENLTEQPDNKRLPRYLTNDLPTRFIV